MFDHDQRFKALIREFFVDFLLLFFHSWAERLDGSRVEWLDKEVFPDPPDDKRQVLDLVARLPTRESVQGIKGEPDHWLALVHIEIASADSLTSLRPYLFYSYVNLRQKYDLPVLPIAILMHVGLDGLGLDEYTENFWEQQPVLFKYNYVGLPTLDGVKYAEGENWLGQALSALMKIPKDRVLELGAETYRRLTTAPDLNEQQRFLLSECFYAYLPLDESQKPAFDLMVSEKEGVKPMNVTPYDRGWLKGKEKGKEEGVLQGRRASLRELLENRFGPLPASTVERLEQLNEVELRRVNLKLFDAISLQELGLL